MRATTRPSTTLVLNQDEVRRLLPMTDCVAVMERAFRALANGDAVLPLRPIMRLPDGSGLMGLMPGYVGRPEALGIKVLTIFPGNHGTRLDSHQGTVLLFHPKDGRVLAIMDASEVTAIRTAAVTAVATKILARGDASRLALIGSGVQARTHLEAMAVARKLSGVRIHSRNAANARRFAKGARKRFGVPIEAAASVREAVADADIICTVTSAREPLLRAAWVRKGAHINAVGSSTPGAREIATDLFVRARLFVDRRESALNEAGDFIIPKREGAIGDDHIRAELADLVARPEAGRTSPDEITLFKSVGLAIEDVAAANYIYRRAVAAKVGRPVRLGGVRRTGWGPSKL